MLFDKFDTGALALSNRAVMSPLTRSRAAVNNTPNALMAEYYGQRATAGLIVTEGTSPSPNGLGYARIPGLFNEEHVRGWKLVTDTVHSKGGKIFVQLMHTGRVAHIANLPAGAERVGIRLSPHGTFNGTGSFAEVDAQYLALTSALSALGLAYVHVLDHSALGAPPVPFKLKTSLREAFKGVFILAGGFDTAS